MEKVVSYLSLPSNVSIYKELVDDDVRSLGDKLGGIVFDYVLIPSLTKKIGTLAGNTLTDIIEFLSTNYTDDKGVNFTRQTWISAADDMLFMYVSADKAGAVNFSAYFPIIFSP